MLKQYQQETAVLLATIRETVESDGRFCAAWLFGSFGRGDNDALSDIDIWLIVKDEAYASIVQNKKKFIEQFGTSLFTLDVPQNAPPHGEYLAASYEAPFGPHHVDFYWQPQSKAVIPPQMKLLFDKVGIPSVDEPLVFPGGEPDYEQINRPSHFVPYFWIMVMVSAKYLWRSPDSAIVPFLPYFLPDFHKAQAFLKMPKTHEETAVFPTPHAKFEFLMQLAKDMQEMVVQMVERESAVSKTVYPAVERYLTLLATTYLSK